MTTATKNPTETRVRYAVLDGRSAKALALACSTEEARHLLQYARVREDGVFEATNGHILTRMAPTCLWDEEHSPTGRSRTEAVPAWLIHRDDLKRLKFSQLLRLDLETGELVVLDKNGQPEVAIPGGASTEATEGEFPDTDRIYSAHARPECFRFRVAARYLKRIAKMAKAAGVESVTLEVPEEIEAQTSGGYAGAPQGIRYVTGETEGLLMPWRLDD